MVETPKPSEIQNVLAMDDPQQMLGKAALGDRLLNH